MPATHAMGRLEFATPRDAWGYEATGFTPLLGQDDILAYLGATCGVGPLSLVETEHATAGSRSLDILAVTSDQRKVAIENQYGAADHDHLTRGLAYAVAVDAKALVLVAEEHRDEFVSVANYLNTVAAAIPDAGINVWLVKVRAVRRVGDSIWSPEFVVMAQPNDWEAANIAQRLIASLDDFYRRCAERAGESWASTAREIVSDWLERDGTSEGHNAQGSVGLYYRSRSSTGRTNVLQVYTNGALVLCRGYIREASGLDITDEDIAELDTVAKSALPNLSPKPYYPTATYPSFEGYRALADYIVELLNRRSPPNTIPEGRTTT